MFAGTIPKLLDADVAKGNGNGMLILLGSKGSKHVATAWRICRVIHF